MTGDSRGREARSRERDADEGGTQNPPSQAVRERLIDAFTKVAAERGYAQTNVADVAASAGVSQSEFFNHFSNKKQCLSAAHDAFFDRLIREVAIAVGDETRWPLRVKAAVEAVLEFVEETATRSRLFAVEVLVAGPLVLERHDAAVRRVAPLLREGREHFPEAGDLPELTEALLIGGATYLLCSSLLAEERLQTSVLTAELVELLLGPYVGRGEARRIAA